MLHMLHVCCISKWIAVHVGTHTHTHTHTHIDTDRDTHTHTHTHIDTHTWHALCDICVSCVIGASVSHVCVVFWRHALHVLHVLHLCCVGKKITGRVWHMTCLAWHLYVVCWRCMCCMCVAWANTLLFVRVTWRASRDIRMSTRCRCMCKSCVCGILKTCPACVLCEQIDYCSWVTHGARLVTFVIWQISICIYIYTQYMYIYIYMCRIHLSYDAWRTGVDAAPLMISPHAAPPILNQEGAGISDISQFVGSGMLARPGNYGASFVAGVFTCRRCYIYTCVYTWHECTYSNIQRKYTMFTCDVVV